MSGRPRARMPMGHVVLALALAAPAYTQEAAPEAETPKPGADALPSVAVNPAANYSYHPEGRRDPFVSLVGRGVERAVIQRGEGLQALTAAEISVRGVLHSRGGYVAIVQGPDQKTHIVRPNDRLSDGTVTTITPQGLVILQEVTDPLSLVKHKEVRKGLPGSEGN